MWRIQDGRQPDCPVVNPRRQQYYYANRSTEDMTLTWHDGVPAISANHGDGRRSRKVTHELVPTHLYS